jgi:hypothetical protein
MLEQVDLFWSRATPGLANSGNPLGQSPQVPMQFRRVRIGIGLSAAAAGVTASYFVRDGPRQTGARYVKHEYRIPRRLNAIAEAHKAAVTEFGLFCGLFCAIEPKAAQ